MTTSLKALEAKLVGISLSCEEGCAYYIPIFHTDNNLKELLQLDFIINHLNPILSDISILKIGQNIKYDILRPSRNYRR